MTVVEAVVEDLGTDVKGAGLVSTTEAQEVVSEEAAEAREGLDQVVATDMEVHPHQGLGNVATSVPVAEVVVALDTVQADQVVLLIVQEAPKVAADSKLLNVFQFCI